MSACEDCGLRLYFAARLYGHRWCLHCACRRGVSQLGCWSDRHLAADARRLAVWWRWTVGLGFALALVDAHRRAVLEGRSLG